MTIVAHLTLNNNLTETINQYINVLLYK